MNCQIVIDRNGDLILKLK